MGTKEKYPNPILARAKNRKKAIFSSKTWKCVSGMKSVLPHLIIIKSPKIALIIAQASYYRFVWMDTFGS